MPGADGLAVLRSARARSRRRPCVLVMTAHGSVETRGRGAARGRRRLHPEAGRLRRPARQGRARCSSTASSPGRRRCCAARSSAHYDFEGLVGQERRHARGLRRSIRKVAPTQSTVLITGESGTGKEVVARAIHHYSQVAAAHLPARQLRRDPGDPAREPALRARARRVHRRRHVAGGALQPRARAARSSSTRSATCRSASSRSCCARSRRRRSCPSAARSRSRSTCASSPRPTASCEQMVERGHVPRGPLLPPERRARSQLPPLRERREDIPSLVEYLVRRHNREMKRAYRGVDNATLKLLMSQPWKGNVRELDNVIEHAMILGDGEWITVGRPAARAARAATTPLPAGRRRSARRAPGLRADPHRERAAPLGQRQAPGGRRCSGCRCRRSTGR